MPVQSPLTYLSPLCKDLKTHWPDNRTINIVCHGHSVPSGYFATPRVDSLHAYPHLLREELASLYPYAVINVIVTAVGGEESPRGAARFEDDVITHKPDVVTIDYGLNDRRKDIGEVESSWRQMIAACARRGVSLILMTPTWDVSARNRGSTEWQKLTARAELIRRLAADHNTALCDSFAAFERAGQSIDDVSELLSWANHPNHAGHKLVACELMKWFRCL